MKKKTSSVSLREPVFSWSRAALISLPFFALTMFWQAYDYIVPLILSQHYSLSTTAYSVVMSIDNIVALIFLPLFGILSDRISGKLGRRSPVILLGTIGGIAGLSAMILADSGAVAGRSNFPFFFIALTATVFFMNMQRAPSSALVADCFIRPQRTKANAMLNLMGALAGVTFGLVGRGLIRDSGGVPVFTDCMIFVAVCVPAAVLIYFLTVQENRFSEEAAQLNRDFGLIDEKTDLSDHSLTKLTRPEKRSFIFILLSTFFMYMAYNGFHTCAVGIVAGSFFDFNINVALANKTSIGAFFATYGSYFSYCLYPAAGACLFAGLRKKGSRYNALAWTLLVVGWFMAVYYSNSYNGSKVRELFAYVAGESAPIKSVLSWLFWGVLYAWVAPVVVKLADDSDPDRLIAVGAAILLAGIVADNVNLWLKQVGSRPRYKYLITLDDPRSEYRNWWQMAPNLAGSNDNFKSWPSGNMTIASMMFALPMLTDVLKNRSARRNLIAFVIACAFVLLYGYNRIHMTNHFLTDVCFGTLITYLIYAGISTPFLRAAEKR